MAAESAKVPVTIPRIETSHEMNWANACKGQGEASAPFSYSARLNETMLLGMAALRAGQGLLLKYDGAAMRFTNNEGANRFLTREYRAGWAL
jgi:hypothetical protein